MVLGCLYLVLHHQSNTRDTDNRWAAKLPTVTRTIATPPRRKDRVTTEGIKPHQSQIGPALTEGAN